MMEKGIGFVCCLLCAWPFFIYGHFAKNSGTPLVFWTGDEKRLKTIVKDIAGYNREIAKLYLFCALFLAVNGVIFLVHAIAAYLCLGLMCTVGGYAAWKRYKIILNKYDGAGHGN